MFSDFDASARRDEDERGARGRRTVSLLIAALIFGGVALAIGGTIATAHVVIEQRARDVEVEFAALEEVELPPEPEPPPPPPDPRPRPRRAAAIADAPPVAIPDARPDEREGALADAGELGPGGDGGGEGAGDEGGTEPPPPAPVIVPPPPEPPPGPPRPPPPPPSQERIEVSPPRMLSGCQRPERPAALEGATAETITIYVRLVVGPDGRVLRASIEGSHALVPDELVLGCVHDRVYEPAHLPDGTAVPYPLRYAFTFVPDVL